MSTAGGPTGLRVATSQSWADPFSWAVRRRRPVRAEGHVRDRVRMRKVAGGERGEGVAVEQADAEVRRRRDHPAVRRESRYPPPSRRPLAEELAGGDLPEAQDAVRVARGDGPIVRPESSQFPQQVAWGVIWRTRKTAVPDATSQTRRLGLLGPVVPT